MSQPAAAAQTDTAETHAELRLAMLRELAQIGMRLARGVERRAEEPEADPAELGLVFSRIARAVRQTLGLEARFEADLQTKRTEAREARVTRRKAAIRHAVEAAIDFEPDDSQAVHLLVSLNERLEDEDETEILDRPIRETVVRICAALGVTPDWSLWEDEAPEDAGSPMRPEISPTHSPLVPAQAGTQAEPGPDPPGY